MGDPVFSRFYWDYVTGGIYTKRCANKTAHRRIPPNRGQTPIKRGRHINWGQTPIRKDRNIRRHLARSSFSTSFTFFFIELACSR